ncbi:MAG: efflux RND transporter periplasmic adaptor subunit [Saprospiraceae bacterium]|nr:efflux RND transporter periplasmic adaptor subunit [Saprospiraceae bacterium]MCF8249305.1 efflux RND transporter periplasmic adaptor subunit [Saprospiraceae bacterium]MCF8279726.1 efflux RND transporter periplasmic adaptor subunit [Bacteroidales bacterium]MCF8311418.1 efflux RND transporter periplasmic adaptor subunit [Saprospiraceae bacterium]MCF8439924.1 efflux RND transporter periplasmic adaptor subunit [Saprospiraceae bacterium]
MKRIIKLVIWTIVLGGLGYFAYTKLGQNKTKLETDAKLTQERNTVIPVVTGKVEMATMSGEFNVVGNFAPYQQVAVMSETAGKIITLNVENGSTVQAGATLLTVDNDLLKIQLETTKTNLAKAENDLARLQKLLGEGGVTQQQIDDAKLGIANLKQQIKASEKQISMSYVKAPISGVVTGKMVEKGSLIAPAMQLATITNISRLKMQVYLTEDQVVTIKKGQRISMQADLFQGKKFEGTVTFIDVNAGSARRYLVEIEILNTGDNLKAGMTGTVFFKGGSTRQVLSVPREAIVGSLQDAKIYVIENGKAILRPVVTGDVFDSHVQVKDGVKEGEPIVVSGQINLEDGMEINIAGE